MGNVSQLVDREKLTLDIKNAAGQDILDIHDLNLYQPSPNIVSMSVHIRSR